MISGTTIDRSCNLKDYYPDVGIQVSKRYFSEGASSRISRVKQLPSLEYSDSFQSDERALHSSSENVQSNQIEHSSYLHDESPSLSFGSYKQQ